MTDKEKILVMIESLLNETNYEPFTDEVFGRINTLKELKSYIDSLQEESDDRWLSNRSCDDDIEYTRTDAFIEKACNGIEKLLSGYIIRNFNFGDSYDIDRLIEDFRNYMKGE